MIFSPDATSWRQRLTLALASPRAAPLFILLAVLCATPSLTTGLCADDWLQMLIARGLHPLEGLPQSRLDLFSFAGREPGSTALLVARGVFPWWTDPQVKLAFLRPLAALTHLADWTLWPGSPAAMHAHSLLWFALALAAAAAVYRRFLSGWAAGLATALYCLDDAHATAASWVANRNALLAVACALPVLLLHDRHRRQGSRAAAWLGPLLLAVALLCGEASLAVVGYLLAYALCLDEAPRRARAASLLPYLGVVLAWRILYRVLGYGTAGSGIYLDPAGDPLGFLAALPGRASFLLAAQLALPWSDLASLWEFVSPAAPRVALAAAVATVALLALLFWPLCRRDPVARFFALGTLFSVVPVAATVPADRLLLFVGVGAMGLLARWFEQAERSRLFWAAAAVLGLIHLVLAPPLLALRSARAMAPVTRVLHKVEESLPPPALLAGRTLVLVNPISDFVASYFLIQRATRGEAPARLRWLASATSAVTLEREDERTLRVRVADGLLAHAGERMLRDPARAPFAAGDRVRTEGFEVEILQVLPDGRPLEYRARFDRALEDPSLYWAAWDRTAFRPFTPPVLGASVSLPAVNLLEALFPRAQ